ncbi:MAG TPA: glycosyltransferase [Tepidisphaeraceae bacterium]|nr:glycosyltransferase [Tepidisphaeraceae bacterium]
MNILLAHNFYQQPGGEDQVFAEEARLLESHGHQVTRFTMDNDAIDGMGRIGLARKTIWNRESQAPLRKAIRDSRAQVVHFHNTFPLISPAAYYTAHEEGAAVVQTLHNYRLICPAATFYRAGGVCEQCLGRAITWPAVRHACYRDSRPASAAITAMLAYHKWKNTWSREVDLYIALTEFAASKFVQGGFQKDKVLVKSNFVDPDPGFGSGDGDYALFVGRLAPEKGVALMIQAWQNPKLGINLKIIGDGPLRGEVEKAAASNPQVQYLGRRALSEVYGMMGSARLLVFPSQWYEGQPRTILESFAKGTPVVACRLGSMPELIQPGRTGLLFEPGDACDLAQKVTVLHSGQIEQNEMRKNARKQFEQHFTAAQNYPILLGCYNQALGQLGGASGQSTPTSQDRMQTP